MRRFLALLGLILLAAPTPAFAHKVDVACQLSEGKVIVEGFYDDDTPAIKAKVAILDAQEKAVANGITDDKGRWSFPAPPAGKYEVRLDAGAGHRAKRSFVVPPGSENASAAKSGSEPIPLIVADRADATAIPWIKALVGVAFIGGCSGAFLLASMLRKNTQKQVDA